MAAVTLLGSVTFDTNSGTKTVTATPAVDDLIVIVTAHSDNTSAATPTDDQGGTYTTIVSATGNTSLDTLMVHIRTALIPAASSTIFTHAPGASSGGGLAILKVTGMSRVGASAALQNAKQDNQAASTTPAPVFGATPQSGNPVIGAVFNLKNPATLTPRSSPAYTELADMGYNTPSHGLEVMSINSGETSATITWGGTSVEAFCDAVVELDTSPVAYTLSCNPGAFTVTGAPLTLTAARMLSLSPGAFTLTGAPLTMNPGWELSCNPGAFTVTGAPLTALADRMLTVSPGTFTVTGAPLTPLRGYVLFCDPAIYTLTGFDLLPLYSSLYVAPVHLSGESVSRPQMTGESLTHPTITGESVTRTRMTDETMRI